MGPSISGSSLEDALFVSGVVSVRVLVETLDADVAPISASLVLWNAVAAILYAFREREFVQKL